MKKLVQGEFYGTHYQKSTFEGLTITDTEYTHRKVDWHSHENPYFTYLLEGELFEANKKESYYLKPGSLLFHNWQDEHYNVKPPTFTRGFHIEMTSDWFANFDVDLSDFEGSMTLKNPLLKHLMHKVFLESKVEDAYSNLSMDASLVELFSSIKESKKASATKPTWVVQLQELIEEEHMDCSLKNLSNLLGIHPVHLSRSFRTYFGTSLGNYIRYVKVNKAFCLITSQKLSMTEICYQCGFYDQSHFIANFKRMYGSTPTQLIKPIS